jgi:hypothetical protein
VTETDSANERPPVQEESQSKECDANHDPEYGCVREDQDRDTDQRCDYPERSHGAFSRRLTPLTVSVLLSALVHDRRQTVWTCVVSARALVNPQK